MTTHSENAPGEFAAESLMHSFVTAQDADSAQTFLDRLFQDHAQPLVRYFVRLKLRSFDRSGDTPAEQQDICQEVAVQLLTRLREIRANPSLPPIGNFRSYVITCAQNACYRRLRLKRPARWRLKNRVRYVLNHKPQFGVWCDQSEQILCGLASWAESSAPTYEGDLSQVDLSEFVPEAGITACSPAGLVELVEQFLQWYGRPILLDSLTGALAEICGVREPQFVEAPEEPGGSSSDFLRDPSPSPARRLAQKEYLQHLWREIRDLPLNQRLALLLNMRDSAGAEAMILLTQTGTTTLREIAAILSIQYEDFVELWNHLPLDDNTIAARLGVTRQQVINLRKSARERLARRTRALERRP